MKKHLFQKSLLIAIGLLVTSIPQVWADNEYGKRYLYFNGQNFTSFFDASATPYISPNWAADCTNGSNNGGDKEMTQIGTSYAYYLDLYNSSASSYTSFRAFYIGRSSSFWDGACMGFPDGKTYNCIWANDNWGSYAWGYYAVPITSIALAGSGSAIMSGSGTEDSPYRILVGDEITLTATPTYTPADNTMTLCANFGTSPSSSPTTATTTGTYTVSSTSKVELKCIGRNKYGDVYSGDVTSSSVWVQGVASYTLNYSIGDVKGNNGSISSSPSTASGSNVQDGTTITLTAPNEATGYTWKGWYLNSNGSGVQQCSTKAYAVTVSANTTLYACYTENTYSTNVAVSPAAKGSITSPTPAAGKINVSHHTGTSVTATPITNYAFEHWGVSSGGLSVSSTTTNPATFKATSANGTITAYFVDQWAVTGFGNDWSTYYGLPNSATNVFTGTATLTKGNHSFKVKDRRQGANDGWYGNSGTVTRASNTATGLKTSGDNSGNITITADVAGTYTFSFNTSTKVLTVTYPEAYSVTYSAIRLNGSGTAWSGAPSAQTSASLAVTSGDMVLDGSTVTFTAQAPNTGYTFQGWYSTSTPTIGTTDPLSSDSDEDSNKYTYTTTLNDAGVTVYAIYTEDMHTVTVTASTHGSITTPVGGSGSTVQAGISTSAAIVAAAADYGYVFSGWTVTSGESSDVTFGSASSLSTTVKTKSDVTICANFVSHWTVVGGDSEEADGEDALGNWNLYANAIDNFEKNASEEYVGYVDINLPANTTFYLKIRDLYNSNWYSNTGEMTYTNNTGWTMNSGTSTNCRVTTAGKGTYRFTFNENTKKLTVTYPTSYTVTYNVSSFYNEDASHDYDNTTGGTISYKKDNDSISLVSGKYVVGGGTMTFKATPATGYTFAGWYSNQACTTPYTNGSGGAVIAGGSLALTITGGNKTVYAKFQEKMTTVKVTWTDRDDFTGETCGWVSKGGVKQTPGFTVKVGVHTSVALKAEADSSSHYFAGWYKWIKEDISTDSVGADYHAIMTLHGLGAGSSDQSVYFSFAHLDKIYFKNWNEDTKSALWDSVYVGFNPNHDGLGANVWGKSADDVRAMRRVDEDNYDYVKGEYDYYSMWWSYVPRHMTRTGDKNVVFFNKGAMRSYEHFAHGKAADRGDYSKKNNMFVPASTKKETLNTDCDYYSNGYWRNYWVSANSKQGYYLQKKTGDKAYEELGEFVATKDITYKNDFLVEMEYTVRFDNTNDAYFRIVSAGGEHYVANATITSAAPSSFLKVDNGDNAAFTLKPTAEGNYIITIVQHSDTMDISVDYPVAIGDYVLENTYTGGKKISNPALDSIYVTRSNVIKAAKADEKTRYSMYIGVAGSPTLKLRKCTAISDKGAPTWSTGTTTNLDDVLTEVGSTPGVYQFDITVNKANDAVSNVDSLRLYSGNYYIKVDAAPGGWAGYINNVMDKNTVSFDRTKSYTYDNYWCNYYGTGTGHNSNIKCVIANDYCNQLSDTLKQDVLSIAWMDGKEPKVPVDGTSIRFSYNSATNTINRSYLAASTDDKYLDLKVYNSAKVYTTYGTDMYTTVFDDTWADTCRFNDTEDWVYEKIVKVHPGGKAGVVAEYQSVSQTFLPDTTTLIGGDKDASGLYTIRLVYDFKTNYMMSAFLLTDDPIAENLSDFDMLWVRHKDNSAAQLTLSSGKSLTNVRPIGAIEFRYDSVHYQASHTGNWVDLSTWDEDSRPYLKYFVSFPFNVEVNSIFGLNQAEYGRYGHYVIQKYNGAKRAKDGLFFGDDSNFWEDVELGDTLKANEGYCVIFDNDYVRGAWGSMWEKKKSGSSVYLYFPAMTEVPSITNSQTTTTVDPHTCTISRTWISSLTSKTLSHEVTDSHWNLIGVPLFHDAYIKKYVSDSTLRSYYYMDLTSATDQDWQTETVTTGTTKLKAMSSVMVQWYGTITWGTSAGVLSAPRRTEEKDYLAQLEIWYNGNKADQTFVQLNDGADSAFALCEDMCKIMATNRANIYTFTGEYDVAYNELPIENCTVPVGVFARRNGTYTFSMPKNFSGTITLIDTYAQARTNLALEDYEVYLNKGNINDRFFLEININNAPTAIDGVTDGSGTLRDGKAHKFIMNDMLYILKDGVLYDAQGHKIE